MQGQIISKRGLLAAETELRTDIELFFEAAANIWSRENLDGKFPLNMAENNLSWDLLKSKMEDVLKSNAIPKWVSNYVSPKGAQEFSLAVSQFMSKHLTHCKIDETGLVASAGASASIELLSWTLCDSGEVMVIPAPAYPVYKQDINNKPAVERYDLRTHHDLHEIEETEIINISQLELAKKDIESQGKVFKVLLLTTPDNPTGRIFSRDSLNEISNWCIENSIHLIVNELYGLSLLNTKHPEIISDYSSEMEFESFAGIMFERKSNYLHLIYGLSKDFGASGFRIGFIYSLNEKLIEAVANLNIPHMVSNLTQWLFSRVLSDDKFIKNYIDENRLRLTESYVEVINRLKKLKIPYVPSRGSLFVWLDMSNLLPENTAEAENKLWMNLYSETGILLTPGHGLGHSKFGQFRLVHSFLQKDALAEAMNRFEKFVEKNQQTKYVISG